MRGSDDGRGREMRDEMRGSGGGGGDGSVVVVSMVTGMKIL